MLAKFFELDNIENDYSPNDDDRKQKCNEKSEMEQKQSTFQILSSKVLSIWNNLGDKQILKILGNKDYKGLKDNLKNGIIAFGHSYILIFTGIFIFFFYRTFINMYKVEKFIAADATSGDCQAVSRPWTLPDILADSSGNWEGSVDFNPTQSKYHFNIHSFVGDRADYEDMMDAFEKELITIGKEGEKQDLARNLIYWTSWETSTQLTNKNGLTYTQILNFHAAPQRIFSTDFIQATVANENNDCAFTTSTKSYNRATSELSIIFDMDKFDSDETCNNTVKASSLGYDRSAGSAYWTLTLDVNTLFGVLAVAHNVNGEGSLGEFKLIDTILHNQYFHGVYYDIRRYYDPQNPAMVSRYLYIY